MKIVISKTYKPAKFERFIKRFGRDFVEVSFPHLKDFEEDNSTIIIPMSRVEKIIKIEPKWVRKLKKKLGMKVVEIPNNWWPKIK